MTEVAPGSATADWDGAQYAAVNGLQRWVAERSLAAIDLTGDERLLDIGCGDGHITAELADRLSSGTAVGIDPSPRMIEVADTRVAGRPRPNLRFAAGAVQTMEFADEFDIVVSFNALHWVADHQTALRHIRRAVVAGGSALLQMVCAGERESVEQTAMRLCGLPQWRESFGGFVAPFHHPDPDTFVRQAGDAGLGLTRLTVDDLEWDFGAPSHFLAWCRVGFSDWMARLPDEPARAEFMRQVGDSYSRVVGSAQIFRFLQMTALLQAG